MLTQRAVHFSRIVKPQVLLGVLGLLITSCGTRHLDWTEDVDLGDGRTIVVERAVSFKEYVPGSGGTYVAEETAASIEFTGTLSTLPPWRESLRALEFYQDSENNEWVVVALTTSCDVWRRRGKPKPSYWEFRLREGVWREVPLLTSSIGRKSNLLPEYRGLSRIHLTSAQKNALLSEPGIGRKYKEIWGDLDMYVCGEGDHNKV